MVGGLFFSKFDPKMKKELTNELVEDVLQWDILSWSKALNLWNAYITKHEGGKALELGANKGGLSLWLAKKGYNVVCTDLENVEQNSKELHEKYEASDKITYLDVDATNIPFEAHFDLIVFKSILGGIGRNENTELQQETFDQIYKALKPGGILLFAENLSATGLHRFARKKFTTWGKSWYYPTYDEMLNYLDKFEIKKIHTNGFLATFGRSEKQRKNLAKLDRALFDPLLSKRSHYIVYGIAQKIS